MLIVTIAFLAVITVSDIIFAWNLIIQVFIFFLQSGKSSLFKFFTFNCWNTKNFREKYMNEDFDESAGSEDSLHGELDLNTRLNV